MITIVIINGYPESGKDTFTTMVGEYTTCFNLLTSTPAKNALRSLGWNGQKTPEVRKLLADLMETSNKLFSTSFKYIADAIDRIETNYDEGVIFIHSREPQNIALLAHRLGAHTLFIKRDNPNREISNDSDKHVEDYQYDKIIDNNGSLEILKLKAKNLVDEWGL